MQDRHRFRIQLCGKGYEGKEGYEKGKKDGQGQGSYNYGVCNSWGGIEGQDGKEQGNHITAMRCATAAMVLRRMKEITGLTMGCSTKGMPRCSTAVTNSMPRCSTLATTYGREYWKELVDGLEASDTDSTDGGNEDAKEGQGEKKEAQKYWIHPEDGQRV